jgi:hypothetical protein
MPKLERLEPGREYPALVRREGGEFTLEVYATEQDRDEDLQEWLDEQAQRGLPKLGPDESPPLLATAKLLAGNRVGVRLPGEDRWMEMGSESLP